MQGSANKMVVSPNEVIQQCLVQQKAWRGKHMRSHCLPPGLGEVLGLPCPELLPIIVEVPAEGLACHSNEAESLLVERVALRLHEGDLQQQRGTGESAEPSQ